ncbi:MAG: hypothetical protein C0617_01205, partial [Desulfuromonas sp.]|uniref:hypothetical protein n=1 Tax=Desulfuromonas sp. TaxID=892 RepID=UPI000CC6B532
MKWFQRVLCLVMVAAFVLSAGVASAAMSEYTSTMIRTFETVNLVAEEVQVTVHPPQEHTWSFPDAPGD